MAKFICEFEGVRGRTLKLYDTKCVIITDVTAGSVITGNATDGEKTVFFCDIVGIQYKKSGLLIGYLQIETPSIQMNNINDNMFSENTFTFQEGKHGITNALMKSVYDYITDRIEEIKYGTKIISEIPDFESQKVYYALENIKNDCNDNNILQDNILKWEQILAEHSSISGRCGMCGAKKKSLVFSEFEDVFGKAQRNLCCDCFFKYNAIVKK